MSLFWRHEKERAEALGELIDKLWRHVVADKNKGHIMGNLTETQKVAEIQAAYDALKAQVAAQATQIASLSQQVANGTPATADQISALAALDQLDTEVEADAAPAPAPAPSAS